MEETKVENEDKSKIFNENDILDLMPTAKIVPKSGFLEPKEAVIKSIKKNQFGKMTLEIEGPTEELSGDLALSNKNYNDLVTHFGTDVKNWFDKKVNISSQKYAGTETTNPGYTCTVKPLP